MGLQRVPKLHPARLASLCVPGDRKPVHLQSGANRRWQLHLCGDQQCHQRQSSQLTHTIGAEN